MSDRGLSVLASTPTGGNGRVGRLLGKLYLSALLALFVAPLDNYLFRWGLLPLRPTILFALGFAPVAAMALLRWRKAGLPLADPADAGSSNALLIAAYAYVTAVYLLWTLLPEATPPGDGADILRVYGLVNLLAATWCARAGLRQEDLRFVLLPAFMVLVATMGIDVLEPGTFSLDGYRAAGIAENSNLAGFSVVLITAAMVAYDRPRLVDMGLLAICAATIGTTFSRSVLLLLGLLLGIWCGAMLLWACRSSTGARVGFTSAAGTVAAAAVLLAVGIANGDVLRWVENKRVTTLLATDGPESLLASSDRARCARYSLDALPGHWWLGRGTGYTRSLEMGPHNMVLEQWVSNGVPGVLGLAALLGAGAAAAWRRRSAAAAAVVALLAAECVFSHNLLDERAPLLVLGLVMGVTRRAGSGWGTCLAQRAHGHHGQEGQGGDRHRAEKDPGE